MIELVIALVVTGSLLLIGGVSGVASERRHNQSLDSREAELRSVIVTDLKSFPGGAVAERHAAMVVGEVVIANDYLKSFLAGLRNIFGGEIRVYGRLMRRARREAVVRMLGEARQRGYDAVCNVRFELLSLGTAGTTMYAVFALGTAYLRPSAPPAAEA